MVADDHDAAGRERRPWAVGVGHEQAGARAEGGRAAEVLRCREYARRVDGQLFEPPPVALDRMLAGAVPGPTLRPGGRCSTRVAVPGTMGPPEARRRGDDGRLLAMTDAEPTVEHQRSHPVLDRLHADIEWYDRHANRDRINYQALKALQITAAAAIPVVAAAGAGGTLTGLLGGLVVVMEGLQQLFRFHETWLGYRRTWRALKSEEALYRADAGAYASSPGDTRLLAERVDRILSAETEQWAALQAREKPAATPS